MDAARQQVFEGRVALPRVGAVVDAAGPVPFVVVDEGDVEVEPISTFLRSLVASDLSPLTVKSYAHDLLRWWRLLSLLDVRWDRAGRDETELLVGWLRAARNPQRVRSRDEPAGTVNLRTGKPSLAAGYATSTINHALSVLSAFYEFHLQFGRGPLVNPAVPGSPEAFRHLALYFDQYGTPRPDEPVWQTLRGEPRPLTYWAMRRVLQRTNVVLDTNWTLHDLRHTAATRMANDPELTLPEVQAVLRHKHLTTTETYLQPRIEDLHDKLQQHYGRARQEPSYSAGYAPEDIEAVFGRA